MALSRESSRYEAEMPMAPSVVTVSRNRRRSLASRAPSVVVPQTREGQTGNKLGVTKNNLIAQLGVTDHGSLQCG